MRLLRTLYSFLCSVTLLRGEVLGVPPWAKCSRIAMVPPVVGHQATLLVGRLAVGIVSTTVLAVLLLQPGFGQVFQDEVHILAPSRPARQTGHGPTLKANVDLVLVNVTVTDSEGRLVSDLQASDFSVLDGKHPQQIRYFSSEDAPVSIAVILDTSRSMGNMGNKVEQARGAAMEFFRYSNPQDELAVVTFADAPRSLTEFTDSPAEIELALRPIEAAGQTALWDAVYVGLREMGRARYAKKAMFLAVLLSLRKKLDAAGDGKHYLRAEPWVVYRFDPA